jgi:hypothetical protein
MDKFNIALLKILVMIENYTKRMDEIRMMVQRSENILGCSESLCQFLIDVGL